MKISYNWLKWYVPEVPNAEKLADIITYHIAEVETVEKKEDGDSVFDVKILPNRAHDLLSHMGFGKELSSLLNISYTDPTPKYKIPESKTTDLKIEVESDKCRRYTGRIVKNVKVGPSPEWVVKHLESIGQRSINNMVDAANLVMFNCGQPTHVFDLGKVKEKIVVRLANDGEKLITLDNRDLKLKNSDLIIGDASGILGLAGVKGGKSSEVDLNTKDLIIEVANFDPISIRKSAQSFDLFTDARKRFENDLSPELAPYGMRELSALIAEMCPEAEFEDVVDIYPQKQEERKLSFRVERISSILGVPISKEDIEGVLKRYNFEYTFNDGVFEIKVPPLRLDLVIEEDMAEEIGRVLGYDKVKGELPKINFKPKINEEYEKIKKSREHLLSRGHSEVMTYVFRDKGEVGVMQSASDKKFLRSNLTDGLKESFKLNKQNLPLLNTDEVKIFEIGTVFKKSSEEIHVAYNEKDKIIEMTLEDFSKEMQKNSVAPPASGFPCEHNFSAFLFKSWSLFPFIARDVAVWVPEGVESSQVLEIIKESMGDLVVRGPELFDQFKKGDKTSYAFRMVFQSHDRTLTDVEVNEVMQKIHEKLKDNGWEVR
ncbi:phenylalanine--tRNA ligase subunit beta [Candidatus Nomurabacteria bacterium]|nr:phenylalanine--tRNA ligase subunit beta [Candidatus Nomurabacteria bacterium]